MQKAKTGGNFMDSWFLKLREYFPAKEMKSHAHMKGLFTDKSEVYKLDEGPEYTLVYFEKEDFLFVDYILVSSSSRGSGLGSKVMERVKKKGKAIILEVDPVTPEDPESGKRVRFYEKQKFKKAPSITYVRNHPVTGEKSEMDIFYWSPDAVTEEWIFDKMKKAYEEVHAFGNEIFYNKAPQPPEEVLQLETAHPQQRAK